MRKSRCHGYKELDIIAEEVDEGSKKPVASMRAQFYCDNYFGFILYRVE